MTLDEILLKYFKGDYEQLIRFLGELSELTGISTELQIRELDMITHEDY